RQHPTPGTDRAVNAMSAGIDTLEAPERTEAAGELRVLHGPQAGSRLALLPGDAYLVGSGDGCSVMLAGAQVQAQHAQLTVFSHHWSVAPQQGQAVLLDGQVCDGRNELA